MKTSQNASNYTAPILATAAPVGVAALSGAGGTTITSCPPDDNSFYCNFVKGFNIFKMILFIIVILVVIYIIYALFGKARKSSRRR